MAGLDPAYVGERAAELGERVLGPLLLGGTVSPVKPMGARLALAIGPFVLPDGDLRSQIDVARVRRARRLAPVDTLPDVSASEWALVAALNDLVQVSNHELASGLTRKRHQRLLDSVRSLCAEVPAPRDLGEALARHATFAAALDLTRTDTTVRWWTGQATFRGQPPAGRLLRWRELRRVRVEEQPVRLVDMCEGIAAISAGSFEEVLGSWLTRSPLTDLASLTRTRPQFGWSASTLSLLATVPGRSFAWRAIAPLPAVQVQEALRRATAEVPAAFAPARALAEAFEREVAEGAAARRTARA
ncbi:MAG: hypothetical protein WKG00_02430 [Polyangiaceae bacterium]